MYKLETNKRRLRGLYKFVCMICVVILVDCKGDHSRLSANELLQIESDVRLLFDHYFEAVRRHGLTAEFEYLDHSSDFFWVPPG
jgi:hypothetical protein